MCVCVCVCVRVCVQLLITFPFYSVYEKSNEDEQACGTVSMFSCGTLNVSLI